VRDATLALLPITRAGPGAGPLMTMDSPTECDYYDLLQISATAEPDTVHRVYRLLAARFHPDNQESGDANRFRAITEAYRVLSDPQERARYDVGYEQRRQQRWRLAAQAPRAENDFDAEQILRLTVLEVLYAKRRTEPYEPSIPQPDLEVLTGTPREHLEFTMWFLLQKKLITRTDGMALSITAEGVEYIEQNFRAGLQTRRLHAAPTA
jgi:curved DNA-binding protein